MITRIKAQLRRNKFGSLSGGGGRVMLKYLKYRQNIQRNSTFSV